MLNNIKNKWPDIIDFMMNEFDVTNLSYDTWLKPCSPYRFVKDEPKDKLYITVAADKELFKSYLEKHYKEKMEVAIKQVADADVSLIYILESETDKLDENRTPQPKPAGDSFSDLIKSHGLNPNFTFYSFVSGKSNELAHAASLAVAENPGTEYRLLYLYGGVGLGKTHLMHAIAIYILKNNPKARILYITSENFMNEYINSIRNNKGEEFRNKFRNLDVLLIDDIQFIAGRDNTQEEFFNTFNSLYNNNKQIVISSDKPPKDINNLEERIKSRFEGGMIVDIQPPNFETRMAILRKKEEAIGFPIDDEVIKYIATNIKSNIRTLEGALSKIVLMSKLEKKSVDVDTAAGILKDFIPDKAQEKITPKKIISVVADHFQVSEKDIISPKKNKELTLPRHVCMYLCSDMTNCTLKDIGEALGNRDHATVIHGKKKIQQDMTVDESLRNDIDIIKKKILP